jgi:aspartyl-tRNA(Asn)/glutamyl-tRNA(Gln) amidotransferase subunit A
LQLYEYGAAELSRMMAASECSAREVTQSVLTRARQTEEKVGAYLTLCETEALESAENVDRRRAAGERLSPLAGIPVAVKDNICTKDIKTTCASKILYNFVPPFDATVVEKLRGAGAVIVGKTNLDEFAMGSSCENSAFLTTRNPRDLSRVPGGSSGGSAAAVAAGSAVLALGSDTGGSIRQPASYCGVVGLKPTYGAVSRYGLVAFASSLDQIGPFARTVEDAAMLQGVICGPDARDATSAQRDYPDFAASLRRSVKGLRIGVPNEYFGQGVTDEVRECVLHAVRALEREGAQVHAVSLPSTSAALSAYYIISSAEASSNLARYDGVKYGYRAKEYDSLTDLYERSRSEGFGDEVKRRIMLGTFVLSSGYYDAYYKRAKLLQRRVMAEFSDAFKNCDAIATPTAPFTAFPVGQNVDDPLSMYAADVCTVTVNIASLPALSVPCGKDAAGLPVGLQLIGPRFSEQALLDAAACYEALTGGFGGAARLGQEEYK